MTKHFFYFFIFISFFSIKLTAQEAEPIVELSAEYLIPNATSIESILSSDNENIYILRKDYSGLGRLLRSVIVESYDRNSLKLNKAIDIDLKYEKKLRTFHEIFSVKGNMFLITSFFNLAKKKNFLFAQKLSERFVPSDNLILIGEIDSKNEARSGDFLIKHSRDSSKVIIFHDLPTKRNENERAEISIYDSEFEKLWDKRINMPYESKLYERLKFEVDNKGNAYVLGKHFFEKRKESRNQMPNYEFIVEAYSEQGEQKDKYQLNGKEKFITDLTFEVNSKEQIICTGFYSDERPRSISASSGGNNQGTIKGIVFFRVDNTKKAIDEINYSPFSLDFIAMNETDRQRRAMERRANDGNDNNDPGLFAYDFREIILRSDGGAVVIAEQYFAFNQYDPFLNNGFNNNFRGGGFRQDSIHVFSDIIVVNINPDGTIEWANSVPKYQRSFNYNTYPFLSFASANYRDKIYMIFNERVDLFESVSLGKRLVTSSSNQNGLALATIDKSGELEIQLLAQNREMGIQVLPTLSKQIGKKEILFYGQSNKDFKLGKITLE